MKLRARGHYSNGRETYQAGQVFDAEPEHACWLMGDSPGTFEAYQEKAVKAPPADKMVRRSRRK